MEEDENLDLEDNVEDEDFSSSSSSPETKVLDASEGDSIPSENSDGTSLSENSISSENADGNGATSEKLKKDSKDGNYQKADSKAEAFKRTVGNKNYYNDKKNDVANQQNQLKNDRDENKKRRDSAQDRLQKAKENHSNQRGFSNRRESGKELKEAKKEDKSAKKEEKEQKQKENQLEKDSKNVAKDSKNAEKFKKRHPVQAAKMVAQNKIDKIKKMIMLKIFVPIILALFAVFIIVEMIIGPMIEAYSNIDKAITNVANFSEKVENLYNGFGFQNSKEAFYDELNELHDRYGNELNIPLLLSTIFYTEGMGYDTKFGNTEETDSDPSDSNGSNSGKLAVIRKFLRDKYDESNETTEDGLTYSVGKIYRLRKLARNQFESDVLGINKMTGQERSMHLKDFLAKYGKNIAKDIVELLQDVLAFAISRLGAPFKLIMGQIMGSKYKDDYFERLLEIGGDFENGIKMLISDVFYSIAGITDVDVSLGEKKCVEDSNGNKDCSRKLISIVVTYRDYKYSKENYEKYLMDHYIENMPELRSMLGGLKGEDRDAKKKSIINEIYENEKLFRDIYLQYVDVPAEAYADSCVGDIDNNLIPELTTPVKIADGFDIKFDGDYSFGIKDGKNHNGVDINETSTGNKAGDEVYAIASGQIEEIGPQSNSGGSSAINNHLFVGDSRYAGIKSNLEGLGSNNVVAAVTSSTPEQWESVSSSGSGKIINTQIQLPSNADSVSVMLGVNSPGQVSNLQNVLTNLHNRYPNATIYYNSTYHVGTNYTAGYVNNSDIDKLNNSMKTWCDSTSWAKYIDVTTNLHDAAGNLKSEYSNDGLHLTSTAGQNQLVSNIKGNLGGSSSENLYSNWIKISHSIDIGTNSYKFYSIYRNVDTTGITLSKGSSVAKGNKIGTIASSSNSYLHFEFRDNDGSSNGKAVDPTNLFIKCNTGTELAGNTNAEKIWNYLISKGYPKNGTAGIMGNMQAESGFISNRIQEDYIKSDPDTYRKEYTEKVDNGTISRNDFINNGPGGGGYGIVQWTYFTRKEGLYDYAKQLNTSIGDLGMQLDYFNNELKNSYPGVYQVVTSSNVSIDTATRKFMKDYENPQDQSEGAQQGRVNNSQTIYNTYANR